MAGQVAKGFWAQYSQAAGVFTIGEVDNGDPNVCRHFMSFDHC